ncbi:L-ascorbate metabolism protein UlaG (beta-lactamase superfamily) [Nocardioides ginsengisegetis]|uniref:L-ascorbate metabolism protein UlaG (Beta-lactamase superfamily) n=1 Tax=Nocardioides ginsengisegetis TaxID=661491 RepID=A0A7W3J2L2_9ACTN|nr:MBL fold metallo-hydrolase [Nocardioides ginsengisegetis]MBA8805141.1 L-ascorbate metabolism protein UlaG (beta-lactamase superfamily) [Nocardioides ginsengisegetis]
MRITKFGHACVRIEHDGRTVVLDPGVFTDPEAVDGADAVLITHEHPDHYLPDHLRRTDAPVFTIDAVAARIREDAPDVFERTTVVAPGESFYPGIPARAVGELHAVIHPEFPRFHNSGYVLTAGEEKVFHPGDALTPPGEAVDVLLVPVSAPWMRASEAIEFARAVKAPRNLAIHDRVYSEAGLGIVDGHMNVFLPKEGLSYVRLADGADL